MLCHSSLSYYYQMIFALAQHHKYSISEIEGLIPFERDLYFNMLVEHIKNMEEQQRLKNNGR
jgi:hypothetical protein